MSPKLLQRDAKWAFAPYLYCDLEADWGLFSLKLALQSVTSVLLLNFPNLTGFRLCDISMFILSQKKSSIACVDDIILKSILS